MPNRIAQSYLEVAKAAQVATSEIRRLNGNIRSTPRSGVGAAGAGSGSGGTVIVSTDTRRLEKKLTESPAVAMRRLRV